MEKKRTTPERITELQPNEIFVFGSNLEGMHGGGAAYTAYRKFGAIMGQGVGLQGQSYGIPTMQGGVETGVYYSFDYNNVHFAVLNTNLLTDDDALTEEQLRNAESYIGFDFESIWTMDGDPEAAASTLAEERGNRMSDAGKAMTTGDKLGNKKQ